MINQTNISRAIHLNDRLMNGDIDIIQYSNLWDRLADDDENKIS